MRRDQLVLAPEVEHALEVALAQLRHPRVLLEDWGLREAVPYGHGVTLLFSGPPGVGKTAAAEALAHALGRLVVVVSYAELESCWVGETEKNIARAFAEARDGDAVLFWDEADAVFQDRDQLSASWETRQANVLLQELERYSGLCILATNRKPALDRALERRIAMKVEFGRPDAVLAHRIWKRLLPAKLPLARDVDVAALARHDLSGGEIKNVVLNAARIALARGPEATLTMADFVEAIGFERTGRFERGAVRVGFC